MPSERKKLPLEGIRVLELSHAVMGPSAGMVLADMGADVIKIERTPHGDDTRRLKGFGAGFFSYFNRNKKSLLLDLKIEEGRQVLEKLVLTADIFMENFAPGTVERLGFGYDCVNKLNPRIIYCSLKGFMPGPYENRQALDEVCQMMGGLAYMTGPSGRPLRAGASVVDIMGGSYGVIGILTALYEREKTGKGQFVMATLFESVVMMVAQHMGVTAITGEAPPPMPERGRAWSIYDLFETADDDLVFIGITSDRHWQRFCGGFGFDDLKADERLTTNNERLGQRAWLLPELKGHLKQLTKSSILEKAEKAGIPFAPVTKPQELFEDPHLNQAGWLLDTTLPDGSTAKFPKIPLKIGDYDFGLRNSPPVPGEGSYDLLLSIGLEKDEIECLKNEGIIGSI